MVVCLYGGVSVCMFTFVWCVCVHVYVCVVDLCGGMSVCGISVWWYVCMVVCLYGGISVCMVVNLSVVHLRG